MTDINAHATTATIVPIRDGKALLEHFTKELSKHDIALTEQPDGLLMELPTFGLSAVFKPERSKRANAYCKVFSGPPFGAMTHAFLMQTGFSSA